MLSVTRLKTFSLPRCRVVSAASFSCLLALSMTAPAPAAPAPAAAARLAIQAAYDDQDAALVARSIEGVMVPYAEDTLFIDDIPGGPHQGREHQGLAAVRQGWLTLFNKPTQKVTSGNREVKEFTLNKTNTGATVLTLHHINVSETSKPESPIMVRIDEQVRHFWAKTGKGWRIKQERLLSVDTFLNGKLIRHNQKPVAR